jgi:hypothetical protein
VNLAREGESMKAALWVMCFLPAGAGAFVGAIVWFAIARSDAAWVLGTVATSTAFAFAGAGVSQVCGIRFSWSARLLIPLACRLLCGLGVVTWFAWRNWTDPL